jgi:hypothetical protein
MSVTLAKPALTRREGSLKPKQIDKLPPEQRRWSDNVLRVLKLPSIGSQARVLAGAISSAEQVMQTGTNEEKQQAQQHRATVLRAGTPPWKDAKKAMDANASKIQLDLLSIPTKDRKLEKLKPSSQGINAAFWINRNEPDGESSASYLCKPASTVEKMDAVAGLPLGGEVIREGLSGRAAQLLARQTGIDIGMPESHVVSLDSKLLPDDSQPDGGGNVTCSVQEARPNIGELKDLNGIDKLSINADQVSGMAIFDTITLNADRHSGNVLLDPGGGLIPIDHGTSFLEPGSGGNGRIADTLGGPHNALLSVSGMHQPMSPKMLKGLKALDPDEYASGLKKDRDQVAAAHPDMNGMISDAAIESSRRSAYFVKLAAKAKPPLSAGAIQVALGGAAKELLDPDVDFRSFRQRAQAVIDRTAPNQDIIKQVCLASKGEFNALLDQVAALGWPVQRGGGAPTDGGLTDPLMMVTIVEKGIKRPVRPANTNNKNWAEMQKKAISDIREAQLDPPAAKAAFLKTKRAAVDKLMTLIGPDRRQVLRQRVMQIAGMPADQQANAYNAILEGLTSDALAHQTKRLSDLDAAYTIAPTVKAKAFAEDWLAARNPTGAAKEIDEVQRLAGTGALPKKV